MPSASAVPRHNTPVPRLIQTVPLCNQPTGGRFASASIGIDKDTLAWHWYVINNCRLLCSQLHWRFFLYFTAFYILTISTVLALFAKESPR